MLILRHTTAAISPTEHLSYEKIFTYAENSLPVKKGLTPAFWRDFLNGIIISSTYIDRMSPSIFYRRRKMRFVDTFKPFIGKW